MTMKAFKIFVFGLLSILPAGRAAAQFRQAYVGVNGLTCSQCSRSVEMQLRKLSFVKAVQMDLEHTNAKIAFREDSTVNIAAIARAVRDAGFSVRFLKADIDRQNIEITGKDCFRLQGDVYYTPGIAEVKEKRLTLQFVGKGYMPKSDEKQFKLPVAIPCRGKNIYRAVLSRN